MTDQELDRILDTWDAPEAPASLRRGLVAALPPRRRTVLGLPLRWVLACAAAVVPVTLIGTSLVDSNGNLGMRVEGSSGGLSIRITPFAQPPIAAFRWRWKISQFSIRSADGKVVGSIALADRIGRKQYGFDYAISAVDGGFAVETGQTRQIVRDGNSIDVDVYRAGEERVFLRMEVSSRPLHGAIADMPLREDQLRLTEPKLLVNGKPAGTGPNRPFGEMVWVMLPGHTGRYRLAVNPMGDAKYIPNGRVDGRTLEFQAGGDRIRIECSAPIATRARALYVFEDTAFQSPVKSAPVFGSGAL